MISKAIVKEFQKIVGKEKVLATEATTMSYSYDAFLDKPVKPDIVVQPQTDEQIARLIVLCQKMEMPITIRGAGSNLSGGAIPLKNGCVISTSAMNKIKQIDYTDMYAVVQPGVITKTLAEKVERNGFFYPPDPSSMSISTLGGNVSENAGGLRGLKYGVTKDYVMGMTFIDADGNTVKTGGKTVKQASGFNLSGFMVGSEGIFGLITEIVLKITPRPAASRAMTVDFDDLNKASQSVADIIAAKVLPATMEILDNYTIRSVEAATSIGLPVDAQAILFIELDGHPAHVDDDFAIVQKICKKNSGNIKIARSESEKNKLWQGRRKALSSLARVKPTLILEDATVPRSKIPDMMKKIQRISHKFNVSIGTFGHAGDGNLHPTILTDRRNPEEMKRVEKAIDEIFDAALELDGTLSGEHGVGIAKARYLEKEFGKGTILFMKKLKKGLDEKNLLNPGKVGL